MRFPIVKPTKCEECIFFRDWGEGELFCVNTNRKASISTGFDFKKPHVCKFFKKKNS